MKNDVDTLCTLWTEDGVLLMPSAPPLIGEKAIRGVLQEQKAKSNGAMTTEYTEDWQEVRILGNYAWQWGTMSQTQARLRQDGDHARQRHPHPTPRTGWKLESRAGCGDAGGTVNLQRRTLALDQIAPQD